MKTIGYFDGTDSALLTGLVANGCGTLPLANDWDTHGKNASHLEPGDVDLIVGYLHKMVPPFRKSREGEDHPVRTTTPYDLLYSAKTNDIPVLVIVPAEHHEAAKQILGEATGFVTLVKPEDVEAKVREILGY